MQIAIKLLYAYLVIGVLLTSVWSIYTTKEARSSNEKLSRKEKLFAVSVIPFWGPYVVFLAMIQNPYF